MTRSGPVALSRWGEGVWRAARRMLLETLDGVGQGESVELVGRDAIHCRRSLTGQELGRLPAEWLAIPARDEFAGAGIETRL